MDWITHTLPPRWSVCFYERTDSDWINRYYWGRFKHVACFGWIPSQDSWAFFEWTWGRLMLTILPDRAADPAIGAASINATVVDYFSPMTPARSWQPFIFCTSAVAQLIGSSSRALRPDALLKDLLREGGKIVREPAGGTQKPRQRKQT